MTAPTPVDVPTIVGARLGAGHDGRAEAVIEVQYPNGARSQLSIAQESLTRALDAAGISALDQLPGQPWTVLMAGLQPA
jgi:hypothetical protein